MLIKYGWSPLVWSIVYLLILLSFLTPFIILTISFMMVPPLVLYLTTSPKYMAVCSAVVLLLASVLSGANGWIMLLIGIFYLVPTVVMGYVYQQQKSARSVMTSGIVAVIANLLLLLVLISAFGPNAVDWLSGFISESYNTLPDIFKEDIPEELIGDLIFLMTRLIPLYIIMLAFFYAVVTHVVTRHILKRHGVRLQKMAPVKDWMLPRSLLWYFLIALLMEMFLVWDKYSAVFMVLMNLIPLLTFAFAVQAVSFLFFLADHKKWNRAIPYLGIIPAVLFPTFVSWLGVLDVAFKMRERLKKS